MNKQSQNNFKEFEHIITLILEAKSRVFVKANSELVLLYFNVGKIVSEIGVTTGLSRFYSDRNTKSFWF